MTNLPARQSPACRHAEHKRSHASWRARSDRRSLVQTVTSTMTVRLCPSIGGICGGCRRPISILNDWLIRPRFNLDWIRPFKRRRRSIRRRRGTQFWIPPSCPMEGFGPSKPIFSSSLDSAGADGASPSIFTASRDRRPPILDQPARSRLRTSNSARNGSQYWRSRACSCFCSRSRAASS